MDCRDFQLERQSVRWWRQRQLCAQTSTALGAGPIGNGSTLTWTFNLTFAAALPAVLGNGNIRAAFNNADGGELQHLLAGRRHVRRWRQHRRRWQHRRRRQHGRTVPEPASMALFGLAALGSARPRSSSVVRVFRESGTRPGVRPEHLSRRRSSGRRLILPFTPQPIGLILFPCIRSSSSRPALQDRRRAKAGLAAPGDARPALALLGCDDAGGDLSWLLTSRWL